MLPPRVSRCVIRGKGAPVTEITVEPLGRAATKARTGIESLIQEGVFAPNQKLPGERDLAELVGVSRSVLRDALASLAADGVLESSPWRGWFVRGQQMSERVELTSFTQMARRRGMTPTSHVLRSVVRASTAEEAASLAIVAEAPVIETRRVRSLDGTPACYDVSVIPCSRAEGLVGVSLEDASLYATLEELAGIRIVRSDYAVRAGAADAELAAALGISEGEPVLIGEEVAYDAGGTAILLGQASYRKEMYRFQATLFRRAQPEADQ